MDIKSRWFDFLLPLGIIACLIVIFMPLPTALMDILLAANITVGVVVLLGAVYVRTPLELSIFPSLLLATTLARLALNIGTTRLILTRGAIDHEQAAGGVILGFSQFVTGDNIAVGLVIFAIIVVVQFVVITKGATRISEVAARFALDGLPGRQMAIDAELNSGVIDGPMAQERRAALVEHADFYGAMDGASKFVRGDAIAGVVITAINIIGGLAIGLGQGMALSEAADTFTKLTIGDGLVSQLPALLISLAAGLLVTRSTRKTNLPHESIQQVFARPVVLVMAAGFVSLLIFTSLPKIPLALIAGACLLTAWTIHNQPRQSSSGTPVTPKTPKPDLAESSLKKLLSNDPMTIELGIELLRLADRNQGGDLLSLVSGVRQRTALERGIVLPKIRIRDNLELPRDAFMIRIQGNVVLRGALRPDSDLAIDRGKATGPIANGAVTGMPLEDMMGQPAFWIQPSSSQSVRQSGYEVLSAGEVLVDLLQSVVRKYASEILTRDAAQQLIDEIRIDSPAVVDDLIPKTMSVGQVQQVLKSLLDEGVSIRPLALILETLGDYSHTTANRWELIEKVRIRLGRYITASLVTPGENKLFVSSLEDGLQDQLGCAWERCDDEIRIDMSPEIVENIALSMQASASRMLAAGHPPVLLVEQSIRPVLAELAYESQPRPVVIGAREVRGAEVEVVDWIKTESARSAA